MDPNPLAEKLEAMSTSVAKLHRQRASLLADLDWHDRFDRAAAAVAIDRHEVNRNSLAQQRADVSAELAPAKKRTSGLEDEARLGWDPTYWFSESRAAAKSRLSEHCQRVKDLESKKRKISRQLKKVKEPLDDLNRAIAKFDNFDRQAATEALDALDAEIPLREFERDELADRKAELDRQLKAPLKELKKLASDLEILEYQLADYKDQLRGAEYLDVQISQASNGRERAILHHNCEGRFGNSSPRAVIRDTRAAIRGNGRHIAAVSRNIEKVESRIEQIGTRGSRVIRALIVDGNNLCYEGRQFLGLAALRPLCRRLAGSYGVTVVFDASIRRALGVNDRDLEGILASVKVHVVATQVKADETILDAAQDEYVFVLSNDRYAEYREKAAVRDDRLIRREIINGRVLVHDLAIDEPFAART